MRILVTGRSGQLASALAEQAGSQAGHEITFLGRPELDLEAPSSISERVGDHRPDIVINAAAYTAVDKAESEPERAMAINRDGASALARAAAEVNAGFIHLSTDYVFDGRSERPYRETDETAPLNVYGRSKLEGERAVLRVHPHALILRTSWVYSVFGTNFLKTMLRIGRERNTIRVVDDQFGNPTAAADLAAGLLKLAPLVRAGSGGLYHLTGQGSTSWYGFARFIFAESARLGGPDPSLEAIPSQDFHAAAARPANSRLDCSAIEQRFGIVLPSWQLSASACVRRCLSAR